MSDEDINACLRHAAQAARLSAPQARPAVLDRAGFERGAAYGLAHGLNYGMELLRAALYLAFVGDLEDMRRFLALAIPSADPERFPLDSVILADPQTTASADADSGDELEERDEDELEAALLETVGPPGRMVALSKSDFEERHPDSVVEFNANLVLSPRAKVWHGDLSLSDWEPRLHELARLTGRIVFVLQERDGRFKNEARPLVENAVFSVTPSGHTRYDHEHIERGADGVLRRRPRPPKRGDP